MGLNFEDDIIHVVKHVSKALGDTLEVSTARTVRRPGETLPDDSALALFVDGKDPSDDIVLKISNSSFPEAVEKDVARARDVAVRVGQKLGQHIVAPVYEGKLGNQSFAAYTRLSPLSDYRLPRYFQRSAASRQILPWLVKLAAETRQTKPSDSEYAACFVQPLETLIADKDLSPEVRACAQSCAAYVTDTRPDLFTVFEHGDLWIGNVLFQRKFMSDLTPTVGDFGVIDWGGAREDGYPCIDLARFCASIYRIGAPQTDSLVSRYLEALEIPRFDMTVYCMLSVGQLAANLDQFSKERFGALSNRVFRFVKTHGQT